MTKQSNVLPNDAHAPIVCNLVARAIETLHDCTEAIPPRGNVLSFLKHTTKCRDAVLTLVAAGLKLDEIAQVVDHPNFTRMEVYGLLTATMAREFRHTLNSANQLG